MFIMEPCIIGFLSGNQLDSKIVTNVLKITNENISFLIDIDILFVELPTSTDLSQVS